jgi:8-oxo-(d)GTP phosphatase
VTATAPGAPAGQPGENDVVAAAGVVCWRPAKGARDTGPGVRKGTEVALVHRPRHRDWSLPKGKQEPDEPLAVCAVREAAEETGAEVLLGRPLPTVRYPLPDGRDKEVRFWSARVLRVRKRTASRAEIDDVVWLPVAAAAERLTHDSDRTVLAAFAADTHRLCYPVVIVRHVTARPRDAWPRADADRPLVTSGRRQARDLAALLACWRPEQLLSSPWRRCVDTLEPYRARSGAKLRTKGGLSEDGFRRDPGKAVRHTEKLLQHEQPVALCTHRPVLPAVLDAVRGRCLPEVADTLPAADPYLATGEVLVLHLTTGTDGPRVVAAERHRTGG